MALSQKELDSIQAVIRAEVKLAVDQIVTGLKTKLDQFDTLLQNVGKTVQAVPGQITPGVGPKDLAEQLASTRSLVTVGVVEALREAAPRLFGEKQTDEEKPEGELSENLFVVELDGVANISGAGSIKLTKGQIIDRRQHPVEEMQRQRIALRRLYSSEALRFGFTD